MSNVKFYRVTDHRGGEIILRDAELARKLELAFDLTVDEVEVV